LLFGFFTNWFALKIEIFKDKTHRTDGYMRKVVIFLWRMKIWCEETKKGVFGVDQVNNNNKVIKGSFDYKLSLKMG
jgi:hypothetical protein